MSQKANVKKASSSLLIAMLQDWWLYMDVAAQPFSTIPWNYLLFILPGIKQDVKCSNTTFSDMLLSEHTFPVPLGLSHTHLKTNPDSHGQSPAWKELHHYQIVPLNSDKIQQTNTKSYKYKSTEIINAVPRQKLHSKIQHLVFCIFFWNAQPIITPI